LTRDFVRGNPVTPRNYSVEMAPAGINGAWQSLIKRRGKPMRNRVIWIKEVPSEYPVSERFLRRLVAERRIRSYRVGRKVYLAREDLDELLVDVPALHAVSTRSAS
jgi:excisionase family DNA binding protein